MRLRFISRMAWRDSRSNRGRLLFFSLSITLGVASLVAIGSLRQDLARAIDDQARMLIGADLVLSSSRPFQSQQEQFLESLGGLQAREIRLNTMAVFPEKGTRLIDLRALDGDFPFYGKMETVPAAAAQDFRHGSRAVVDASLLLQFRAEIGDKIKIGDTEFTIGGALQKIPGDASVGASFAPRVYVSLQDLVGTHLLKSGSVARFQDYIKFPLSVDVERRISSLVPHIRRLALEYDTVEKRKNDLGDALENLYRFLNLVGFISLLLGAVGVASAIHAHLQLKVRTGAILRCFGASGSAIVSVYLLQVMAMGFIGATSGAALGLLLQHLVPDLLRKFLPLSLSTAIAWTPAFRGIMIGIGVCVLFALPPLFVFRRVSPLQVLRGSVGGEPISRRRDPIVWLACLLIAASLIAGAVSQSETWLRGLIFAGALGLAMGIFAGVAKLLIVLVRKRFPSRASFVVRQGLANLYRPNNRTLLLILALGLGTFLLLSVFLTRDVLLAQFRSIDRNDRPNLFLFDIQPDQENALAALVRSLHFPVVEQAPIVTMRLTQIKGRQTSDILIDPQSKIPHWELEREYRGTYREHLSETEKITAGQWIGHIDYHPSDVVPISLDQDIAQDFKVRVGDELVFDMQGAPIRTKVASLRAIDWKRFQTNFFVVFPAGVLENAPGFGVLVSRVATPADSARLQSAVVARFPNVSALDLSSVIQTVDSILSRVALVIRIMSFFTVGAGIVVLASTIWSGRYQRVKESILLRTLGASRWQIWKILCAEYFFLGILASLTAIVLALPSSWALAVFVFKLSYTLSVSPLLVAGISVTSLTLLIGLLASRGVGSSPPLEILRAEGD
jgi:putative ABC transport system permease protein